MEENKMLVTYPLKEERRKYPRNILDNPIPVALKSDFSKVIYKNFFMKNYSLSGAWIEFPYNYNLEYALLPILIHKHQKKYYLYLNMVTYNDIAYELQNVCNVIDNNLWLEIPCEIKRYEKKRNSFGLGLEFLKS